MSAVSAWQELTPCPKKYCSQPVQLNCTQFLVAIDVDETDTTPHKNGLYIYDIINNEWRLAVEYPKKYDIQYPSIAIDTRQQLLYINGVIDNALVVNLSTKQHHKMAANVRELGWYPKCMLIDGEYHIICGSTNPYHIKWSNSQQDWRIVHRFVDLQDGNAGPGCCYLQSKQEIILFGGIDTANIDTIWRYRIKDETWHKLHDVVLPTPTNVFGYALSSDERYIFVLGGERQIWDVDQHILAETRDIDDIYVIDLLQWKVMKSSITCPSAAQYHAFISPKLRPNRHLSAGFIRQHVQPSDCVHVPSDIIHLLSDWYCEDYLYLLKTGGHWRINIDHILQNMHECLP